LDGHLPLDADHADDLLHLLETLDDILHYGGGDLHEDASQGHQTRLLRPSDTRERQHE